MPCIKVVILGSAGCGKTSIVRRFLLNQFSDVHKATTKTTCYYPGIFSDNQMFELKIMDTPPMEMFPTSTLEDWSVNGSECVRSAHAYLIVFDVTSRESFRMAKNFRDQLQAYAAGSAVLVVANKTDKLPWLQTFKRGISQSCLSTTGCNSTSTATNGSFFLQSVGGSGSSAGSHRSTTEAMDQFRKELSSIVKKQWKCPFVECSAKWNWNVITVFHELVNTIRKSADLTGANAKSGTSSGLSAPRLRKRRPLFVFRRTTRDKQTLPPTQQTVPR
ncbi:GTP binding protein Di Ras1 [Trichuris trichiura]|uniref:GTP binding protein Di Ras1 n=1 Tax=Trichuris trichiura TaxID=36087 RepID=A0A077Z3C4_TRITR|nr:GTP binding protein Di Ras1 [Trichuris trichiura]